MHDVPFYPLAHIFPLIEGKEFAACQDSHRVPMRAPSGRMIAPKRAIVSALTAIGLSQCWLATGVGAIRSATSSGVSPSAPKCRRPPRRQSPLPHPPKKTAILI